MTKTAPDSTVRNELDVRGMNLEEALMEVDAFIDHALLRNLNMLTIIHGKGTGVLRSGIQQHLKRHKAVKSFRLGVYGEGRKRRHDRGAEVSACRGADMQVFLDINSEYQ